MMSDSNQSVAVVFHSASGSTAQLAQAVAEGAGSIAGVNGQCVEIKGSDIIQGRYANNDVMRTLDKAYAIIFGSPTYMGGVSAQFKAFADASSERWSESGWRNKLAAGFTIGGNLSGDQLATIQYLQILAMQHCMLWVGLDVRGQQEADLNRLGAHSGLIAHCGANGVHPVDINTAFYLGQRVAGLL